MADVVLATLNARYIHCAFGLRYLLANMGELRNRTALLEFTIQQPTLEILDAILEQNPQIVGLGVYIWNVDETTRLVADLKRIRPDIVVVLGGPEVSYEPEDQAIIKLADQVIAGEADIEFARFCRSQLSRRNGSDDLIPTNALEQSKWYSAPIPELSEIALPYEDYSADDVAHRVVYVEASRGCPFTCEFCLSALEIPVRQFPLDSFLQAMDGLLRRGVRQFKFVDRTFNLNIRVGRAILEFFLERYQPGLFLHFEMIPDRLPDALKELIVRFPPGSLQFEVGIQTFNEEVCQLISRRQDNQIVEQNLRWLHEETGVHVHTDLIVGLPGESSESFAQGFDRLIDLQPQEIQVGILKRLRGTPITRHDAEWQMTYSPHPPYEILSTKLMSFSEVQELRRFAKFWDVIGNSGNFVESLTLIWTADGAGCFVSASESAKSPFEQFRRFAAWLWECEQKTHGIPLTRLVERLFEYLISIKGHQPADVAAVMWRDYQRAGRSDKPYCLRPYLDEAVVSSHSHELDSNHGPRRQTRHLRGKQNSEDVDATRAR
jgi:radical SAM superfamily enzyme YgiQ (UPF0313 family)